MKTVAEIMTTDIITVTKDTSIRELAELFVTHRVSTLPVLDVNGKLAGLVTESDLVGQTESIHLPKMITLFDWVIYLQSEKTLEKELQRMSGRTVADIYQPDVATLAPTATINEAADIIGSQKANAIPVLDNGKLVGIVARIDIIRTLLG